MPRSTWGPQDSHRLAFTTRNKPGVDVVDQELSDELPSPQQVRLHYGELKIVADRKSPIELIGPRDQTVRISGTVHYRVNRRDQQLAEIPADQPPLWLPG